MNFRDSKLTRLLQPKLSGNANIAIVCCATPSAKYLEETRSTLQFASRAKLVKTSAKVNELHDDKTIIRRLKQELAEARKAVVTSNPNSVNAVATVAVVGGDPEEIKELQAKVQSLDVEATEAKHKLERLQNLFQKTMQKDSSAGRCMQSQPHRFLGGFFSPQPTKSSNRNVNHTSIRCGPSMTCPRPNKKQKFGIEAGDDESENEPISPVPLNLVRDALSSKSRTIGLLKGTVGEYVKKFEEQSKQASTAVEDVESVREENQRLQSRIIQLEQLNTDMENQLRSIESVYEAGEVVSSREIRAERREILKGGRRVKSTPDWPTVTEITTKDIPAGCMIDMKSGETDLFCTFEFGTLEFLVTKDLAEDAIVAFQKLFLPPVGWVLSCPYNGCTYRCRNSAHLCSHLERRAAAGGGSCTSSEHSWFSHRGPHAFFLHESVVELLKQCSTAQNVKPRDLLNSDAIPVAFGPAARHRWDGIRDELNYEKRLISKIATRFPNGLLENLVEEKEAWFIQQEAKRKNYKNLPNSNDAASASIRPKEYPHLLTMGFLKLPKHYNNKGA